MYIIFVCKNQNFEKISFLKTKTKWFLLDCKNQCAISTIVLLKYMQAKYYWLINSTQCEIIVKINLL
jgi:hypothetical protein